MKGPIILIFPIAAQLLLCASGFPIQQNRDNSVVNRSFPSNKFPIDPALTRRSESNEPRRQYLTLHQMLNDAGDAPSQGHPSTQPSTQVSIHGFHQNPSASVPSSSAQIISAPQLDSSDYQGVQPTRSDRPAFRLKRLPPGQESGLLLSPEFVRGQSQVHGGGNQPTSPAPHEHQ